MTDKWIVGMVDGLLIKMFSNPTVFHEYELAVKYAEGQYSFHGKPFVVFAKKCVIGPSRPPIMKTEYLA